jgi:hypothetical protein
MRMKLNLSTMKPSLARMKLMVAGMKLRQYGARPHGTHLIYPVVTGEVNDRSSRLGRQEKTEGDDDRVPLLFWSEGSRFRGK